MAKTSGDIYDTIRALNKTPYEALKKETDEETKKNIKKFKAEINSFCTNLDKIENNLLNAKSDIEDAIKKVKHKKLKVGIMIGIAL